MSTFKEGGDSEVDVKMEELDPANQDMDISGWTPDPVFMDKVRQSGMEAPA